MKKIIAMLLAALLLSAAVLSGCVKVDSNEKIKVVSTIFPLYDWTRQILGDQADNMELTLLLDERIDLHSFQPSVEDIAKISSCDLFIYVGGESDEWVEDVLGEATNKDMAVINLLDTLGDAAKAEEVKEGMEAEEHNHDDADHHETGYDEHIWLSLKNAEILCPVIKEALTTLDANHAEIYQANLDAYLTKLMTLDTEYQTVTDNASIKTLLFGDRFPFRYLVDDYGLDYYAAFDGCSAEAEASFNTIIFLSGKADELNLHTIMVTESSDQKIAETIRSNTSDKDQNILVLDAMQSVAPGDIENGAAYLSIMEDNLNVLKEALK